ncbi:MAG: MBL fold metallo-hydrolase [Chitinivibrionia bacterium]|nr:MBL fold metallo-hydrolase [Chitinivibrionia bacterium]
MEEIKNCKILKVVTKSEVRKEEFFQVIEEMNKKCYMKVEGESKHEKRDVTGLFSTDNWHGRFFVKKNENCILVIHHQGHDKECNNTNNGWFPANFRFSFNNGQSTFDVVDFFTYAYKYYYTKNTGNSDKQYKLARLDEIENESVAELQNLPAKEKNRIEDNALKVKHEGQFMNNLHIKFLGAAGTVTGSCTLLEYVTNGQERYYLVDAGEFQGENYYKIQEKRNSVLKDMSIKIEKIFITHAHLDHIGILPDLIEWGFDGKIYCTKASAKLMIPMLTDALKIKRKPDSVLQNMNIVELGDNDIIEIANGFTAKIFFSSHILGACGFTFTWQIEDNAQKNSNSICFTGDLGATCKSYQTNILLKPQEIPDLSNCNKTYVVTESTYGLRTRDNKKTIWQDRIHKLAKIIMDRLSKGGRVIIPAFALDRTQQILFDLAYIINKDIEGFRNFLLSYYKKQEAEYKEEEKPHPICVASPLAVDINKVYKKMLLEQKENDFEYLSKEFVKKFSEIDINKLCKATLFERPSDYGMIVIASSGMCDNGSIVSILKNLIPEKNITVILTGYMAENTNGRVLQDKKGELKFSDDCNIPFANIKWQIEDMGKYYSGHADQEQIIAFLKESLKSLPNTNIFINHGDRESREGLYVELEKKLAGTKIFIPQFEDNYDLNSAERISENDYSPQGDKNIRKLKVKFLGTPQWNNLQEHEILNDMNDYCLINIDCLSNGGKDGKHEKDIMANFSTKNSHGDIFIANSEFGGLIKINMASCFSRPHKDLDDAEKNWFHLPFIFGTDLDENTENIKLLKDIYAFQEEKCDNKKIIKIENRTDNAFEFIEFYRELKENCHIQLPSEYNCDSLKKIQISGYVITKNYNAIFEVTDINIMVITKISDKNAIKHEEDYIKPFKPDFSFHLKKRTKNINLIGEYIKNIDNYQKPENNINRISVFIEGEYVINSMKLLKDKPNNEIVRKDDIVWENIIKYIVNKDKLVNVYYYTGEMGKEIKANTADMQKSFLENLKEQLPNIEIRLVKLEEKHTNDKYIKGNFKQDPTAMVSIVSKDMQEGAINDLYDEAVLITKSNKFKDIVLNIQNLGKKAKLFSFDRYYNENVKRDLSPEDSFVKIFKGGHIVLDYKKCKANHFWYSDKQELIELFINKPFETQKTDDEKTVIKSEEINLIPEKILSTDETTLFSNIPVSENTATKDSEFELYDYKFEYGIKYKRFTITLPDGGKITIKKDDTIDSDVDLLNSNIAGKENYKRLKDYPLLLSSDENKICVYFMEYGMEFSFEK